MSEDEGARLLRAAGAEPEDPAATEAFVAWLARRLATDSDLEAWATTRLGELPVARRARVLDAAAARAGVAFGAGALVLDPWLPSDAVTLTGDGGTLAGAGAHTLVLAEGEELAPGPAQELPELDDFVVGASALAVDEARVVVARQLRREEARREGREQSFSLRFDVLDRASPGAWWSRTLPDLLSGTVAIAPDLAGAVASGSDGLHWCDLTGTEARHLRPRRDLRTRLGGFLSAREVALVEVVETGAEGRLVIWDPVAQVDRRVGPWLPGLRGAAASPTSRWILLWGRAVDVAHVDAWLVRDPELESLRSLQVPQLERGWVDPLGTRLVGRREQTWVLELDDRGGLQVFPGGGRQYLEDANTAGRVVVGRGVPQVLELPSRRPVRCPRVPLAGGPTPRLFVDADTVVLATPADGGQRRWDRATGSCDPLYAPAPLACPAQGVQLVAAAGRALEVEVLDPSAQRVAERWSPRYTGRALARVSAGRAPPELVAVDPAGQVVLVHRLQRSSWVAALDLRAREVLWEVRGHPVLDPLGPDERVAMVQEDGGGGLRLLLRDLRTGVDQGELGLPPMGGEVPRQVHDPATGALWLLAHSGVVRVSPDRSEAALVELPGRTRALAFDDAGRLRVRSTRRDELLVEDRDGGAVRTRWRFHRELAPPLRVHQGAVWAVVGGVVRRLELP